MSKLDRQILAQLAEPFPSEEIKWKPQATKGDRALAVAYVDARVVAERLDQVVEGDWSFDWEQASNGCVKGKLTVCGITRCDVGEQGDGPQGKTLKTAVSDALKRSAVLFGLGRYLYHLPAQWVDYDAQHKRLAHTPELPGWAKPGAAQNGIASIPDAKTVNTETGEVEGPIPSESQWEKLLDQIASKTHMIFEEIEVVIGKPIDYKGMDAQAIGKQVKELIDAHISDRIARENAEVLAKAREEEQTEIPI